MLGNLQNLDIALIKQKEIAEAAECRRIMTEVHPGTVPSAFMRFSAWARKAFRAETTSPPLPESEGPMSGASTPGQADGKLTLRTRKRESAPSSLNGLGCAHC